MNYCRKQFVKQKLLLVGGLLMLTCSPLLLAQSPSAQLPDWIWIDSGETSASRAVFSHEFQIDHAVNEARIQFASDFCACVLELNEVRVVDLENFGPLIDADVSMHLRRGKNTIRLIARQGIGPAAVAASLHIVAADSPLKTIVTDSRWVTGDTRKPRQKKAKSRGKVSPQFWISHEQNKITPFDDYTQWKQAQSENASVSVIKGLEGFQIEVVRKAQPDEGSWVSMAFDQQGRITIAREDSGLLRFTLAGGNDPHSVQVINEELKECRGLLYAHGSLYANANNSKAIFRLTDSTNDDRFDKVDLLREFPGGVGHGRNDLALGPDGMIYSIHGDSVSLPLTDIRDLTSPFRDGQLKKPQAQGHLVRMDSNGENWELVATGLRNPFGIDFNKNGDLFTYDADAEFDMGAPWYRPTRVNHLVSGADFGWRGLTRQWPPYQLDHADNALPTATIGKGSPTAVKLGTRSNFPAPWKNAMYILDWAYGRIVACHLIPRGAGYVCRSETFLKGRPLNVTDLDFGPDGAMYFVTGGRETESALYRVRYSGGLSMSPKPTLQQNARNRFSQQQSQERRTLESFHKVAKWNATQKTVWPQLASEDPSIRHAARVALEHQPKEKWKARALSESDPGIAAQALLALARGTEVEQRTEILEALNRLPVESMSAFNGLSVLRSYALSLDQLDSLDEKVITSTRDRLNSWLRTESEKAGNRVAPTGAGGTVIDQLCRLVVRLMPEFADTRIVEQLKRATTQRDRILYLFLLRNANTGWQIEDRKLYFEILNDIEQTAVGGDGMPGFLNKIREDAVKSLSTEEKRYLGTAIVLTDESDAERLTASRTHVRDWDIQDLPELLRTEMQHASSVKRGRQLFDEALCSRCHRFGLRGGVTGPDLTSVSSRFSSRDILKSILTPSDVIAEKYRNVTVITADGRTISGRVLASGDYRSPTLIIATDALKPSETTEISKASITERQLSSVSPMPKGLLSTLTAEEIADLLAFLATGADQTP